MVGLGCIVTQTAATMQPPLSETARRNQLTTNDWKPLIKLRSRATALPTFPSLPVVLRKFVPHFMRPLRVVGSRPDRQGFVIGCPPAEYAVSSMWPCQETSSSRFKTRLRCMQCYLQAPLALVAGPSVALSQTRRDASPRKQLPCFFSATGAETGENGLSFVIKSSKSPELAS